MRTSLSAFPLSPGTSFFTALSDIHLTQWCVWGIGFSEISVGFSCTLCSSLNSIQWLQLHLGTSVTYLCNVPDWALKGESDSDKGKECFYLIPLQAVVLFCVHVKDVWQGMAPVWGCGCWAAQWCIAGGVFCCPGNKDEIWLCSTWLKHFNE